MLTLLKSVKLVTFLLVLAPTDPVLHKKVFNCYSPGFRVSSCSMISALCGVKEAGEMLVCYTSSLSG